MSSSSRYEIRWSHPEGDRGARQRFGYALVGMFAAFGLDMIAGGSYGIYGCIRDGGCGDD